MKLIQPDLLKKLIQHNQAVTFVIAMLNSKWGNVIAKYGPQTKINSTTVIMAKELVNAGLFQNRLDFKNYKSVKNFLLTNDLYMSNSGRRELLKPFQE